MFGKMKTDLQNLFEDLKKQGLYKNERIITTPQGANIGVSTGQSVMNFCANNYLGLGNHPAVVKAAQDIMNDWGYGLASVRFICGTQKIHKDLEQKISEFLGTEDTILYVACFDANGGVFEPLLGDDSAIISDELNHASIIDGVRLCKAQRYRYKHSNMEELEQHLKDSQGLKYRLICTDGVFSMDGDMAKLPEICDLADKYDALVLVDDSHATGYIGPKGRGTPEHFGVQDRVDIVTSTLGKAMGGANGGFTSGRKEIIELLRQRSRPYLFSNSVAPAVVGASLKVIELLTGSSELRDKVWDNAVYFRQEMVKAGFDIVEGNTAIVPVMLYDEPLAMKMADMLLEEGIYVIGFVYPVVPKGKARIRVQLSAAHSRADLDKAIAAFKKIGKELKLI
ncbi:MAG TPA: glycine C-acetyltransferase [Candidatus Cloacimonadota bacterium]|jgi:glycine C-acetyltransferase|nr:glycine C-acetyltransferase [Candidatus Cloacimonadota bacterium]HQL13451.1 glycine C-acetyltransferase [Candidatus Cloacimonadota bacterium]HQO44795.1 glycine C-acetyltransferase [Candidatus Cloacimonadota bacterium]HQP18255.1 glycine C-acetyltransferase [Candidatus Cloacimonadota bacterium]HRS49900.1 glycine C-acetyltransferase [Candidatus Cloacimonadota bacterium]